jgi:hypothetical protein
MFRHFIIVTSLLVVYLTAAAANADAQTKSVFGILEKTMAKVVGKALRSYFGSARRNVRIADDGIRKSWLPRIANVRFILVPAEEAESSRENVFMFWELPPEGRSRSVCFGVYNAGDGGTGDEWSFDLNGSHIRRMGKCESSGLDLDRQTDRLILQRHRVHVFQNDALSADDAFPIFLRIENVERRGNHRREKCSFLRSEIRSGLVEVIS